MGGRFAPEWVAAFNRNQWPVWPGIRKNNRSNPGRPLRGEASPLRRLLVRPIQASDRGSPSAGGAPRPLYTDEAVSERIRQEIAASPFTGEGHRKFWARLRIAGVRSSKARVLRRMREAPLLAPPASGGTRHGEGAHRNPQHRSPEPDVGGIAATATVTIGDGAVTVFYRRESFDGRVRRHSRGQTGDAF